MKLLVCAWQMWGSVEWIIPLCKYMRDHEQGVEISVLVMYPDLKEFYKGNEDLHRLVDEVTSGRHYSLIDVYPAIVRPLLKYEKGLRVVRRILTPFAFSSFIKKLRPDVCLCDGSGNRWIFKALVDNLKGLLGFYPAATCFGTSPDVHGDNEKLMEKHRKVGYDAFDFFLVDTSWRLEFYRKFAPDKLVLGIGPPKYDSGWMEEVVKKDSAQCQDFNNAVLVLLKNESSPVYQHLNFESELRSILEVCIECGYEKIVLKPHPRQDLALLKIIIDSYPGAPIEISHVSSLSLIYYCKLIISQPSGVLVNGLLWGKEVIEYFDFDAINTMIRDQYKGHVPENIIGSLSSLDDKGRLTSIYRKHGFVLPANNKEQLKALLKGQWQHHAVVDIKKSARVFFPDGACIKGAEVLLNLKKEYHEKSFGYYSGAGRI